MTRNIVDLINFKIRELQKNLLHLKQASFEVNKENLKEDIIRYWGIERGIHICVECVLDIANIIISSLGLERPDSYRETILTLYKQGVISEQFAKQIVGMASFRNILVHDYTRVDEDIILDVLKNRLDDFAVFAQYITKWLEENH
ncbi:type VII toxin-antitoxin system HepT family RNase toxin [Caloramator sp. Dgby_cultured_2]|uniref:type VII toxin-antitoxin system HepT family RNase toxin n=1 Tax=Caloramator sp. Dgby_cultured_2 TaxID=3029174 RepID=UPI00237DD038|nr:DUF86 domain-containing protein [Caloramator sp. Dgby_cultured_2]WDU82630.1 DUF86 domain-containing protein [Caloramator sp. Dgby_cultured_2]